MQGLYCFRVVVVVVVVFFVCRRCFRFSRLVSRPPRYLSCWTRTITAASTTTTTIIATTTTTRAITTEERVEQLRQEAHAATAAESLAPWEKILKLQPFHLEARVMLGMKWITSEQYHIRERGFQLLEECFDDSVVSPLLNMSFPQSVIIAGTIGRYRNHISEYRKGKKFTQIAFEASKQFVAEGDVCMGLQLASMLDPFPASTQDADASLQEMNEYADFMLNRWKRHGSELHVNEDFLSQSFPGAAADPYVHCMLSLFLLSFFYRADIAATASRQYQLSVAFWPELQYQAPHVTQYEQNKQQQKDNPPACVSRPIKLGVICGVLSEGHSVTEDFNGVLQRLDRRRLFQVTYIYVYETGTPEIANFTRAHASDVALVYTKSMEDTNRGAWLVPRYSHRIADLQLDMILYLDLTMSTHVRRLGMGRLAPVQLNTHGHPVTSGHDKSIVQYFVSWAEAELPTAQDHYTEELQLIPRGKIHQYYTRRILQNQVSRMDGLPFGHLTRADFTGLPPESDQEPLYVCMQKPFKLHPEFDPLVCGILQKHSGAHVVLHQDRSGLNHDIFQRRLRQAGCDLKRIIFMPEQPHHRLLALLKTATVVLDSYPAGGCTTTREVLELGKALVTLPARLLGGRWTLGYFNIMQINNETRAAVIASTPEEYIDLAVELGRNALQRQAVETEIRRTFSRLLRRQEAVQEWEKLLLRTSPVQVCEAESFQEASETKPSLSTTTTTSAASATDASFTGMENEL